MTGEDSSDYREDQPGIELSEDFRKKEAALARLRSASLENLDLRDVLTLMGY